MFDDKQYLRYWAEKEWLVIETEIFKHEDNSFVLEFQKLEGDKSDFNEFVQDFKQLCQI